MKSFINDPTDIVAQSIEGLLMHQNLAVLDKFPQIKVIVRKDWNKDKVALITGGGSGHQPAHAGYIGRGMLTAVVCGQIFASPSVDAVLSAILAVTGQQGCLLIVKNYTGDRINFGLAAQQARALGHKVQMVIVGDDVSIDQTERKRGIAGTVFVHKIAGFYAEKNRSLKEVAQIARRSTSRIYSIGLSIREHTLFNHTKKQRLTQKQAELGLGIHGEPGAKVINFQNADSLMRIASDSLLSKLPHQNVSFALLLNNLGFVTPIQMNILLRSFTKTSLSKSVKFIVGPSHFMTALSMSGFSLSLLQLNQQTTQALLFQVRAPGWVSPQILAQPSKIQTPNLPVLLCSAASQNKATKNLIQQIAKVLLEIQSQINALDSVVGDGDTGSTLASIAKKVISYSDQLPYDNPKFLLQSIGKILARQGGGSIGVLLSIMFIASANSFGEGKSLGLALLEGLKKMQQYGGAGRGSRTMVDALQPAFEAMSSNRGLKQVSQKARIGAELTKKIKKTEFGRSSYVPSQVLEGTKDPGAQAVARIFEQLAKTVQ